MRSSFFCILLLAALLAMAASVRGQEPRNTPAVLGTNEADLGFDDLMTVLVQPRHLKLYYAGKNKNWELAAAELKSLRSSFFRISQRIPRYLNNDVAESIRVMLEPSMQGLSAAIGTADSALFEVQYRNLTSACNACHVYTEHPFIVIKVPTSAAGYPDQDFRVH